MAKYIGGVPITGYISPTDTSDTFATHDSVLGRGGLREVANLAERDAIPGDRRRIGMLVYVINESKYYALFGDTTNLSWKDCGSQLGGYDELLASVTDLEDEVAALDTEFDQISDRLDKLESVVPSYVVSISLASTFESNELVFIGLLPFDLLVPEDSDCSAVAGVRADAEFDIRLDDTSVGSIKFISGDSTGVVSFDENTTINKNSILTIIAPNTVTDLADVGVYLTFLIRETI